MRRIFLVIAAAAVLGLATHTVRAQQQFKWFASVADAAGNPVATLETTDLKIQEAGLDAKIVAVEPITWPTKLQVLVDNGVVKQLNVEAPGKFEVSDAGTMLKQLG